VSELSAPFASGREADVYTLGDDRVLRRYRNGADATREAGIMTHVAGLGFPVPAVHEAVGADLIMERVDGPTMAEAFLAGDLPGAEGAAMLAGLLRRLHELPAPDGAGTIAHFDLHPENVLITAHGPVVIDWHNARPGPADLDTALTALILAQIAIGALEHELGARMITQVGEILDIFLRLAPGDPLRMLDEAVAMRGGQSTLSAEEVAALDAAAARVREGVA
jgi:aminoglycoside phosphotransferase (APT) family kinase protein